jgi:plastocyanin
MKRHAHTMERARRVCIALICMAVTACSTSQQATRSSSSAAAPSRTPDVPVEAAPAQPILDAGKTEPAAPPAAEKPVVAAKEPAPPAAPFHKTAPAKPVAPPEPKKADRVAAKPPVESPTAAPKSAVVDTTKPKAPPAATNSTAKLIGHIEIVAGANQTTAANDVTDTTIYYIPDSGAAHPKPGRFQIYTRDKQFDPPTLVVPLGSTVSFPNKDQILHNVFSVSPGAVFDLGLYGEGGTAEFTFKSPGLVLINCNVHQGMQANLLVLDTPYFTHADKDGQFQLDVPAGTGKVMVWNPRAAAQTLTIAAPIATPLSMRVTLTKPRLVQHLNKEHKAY